MAAAAHGSQILISEATAAALGESLPAPIELRDVGVWRLKDFEGGTRLFQVCHPTLVDHFPRLRVTPKPLGPTDPDQDVEPAVARRELRTVTIVSAEIALPNLEGSIDPEDYEALVIPRRIDVERILDEEGGHVLVSAGADIVAVFGAPTAWGNDPVRAVRAAVSVADSSGTTTSTNASAKLVSVRVGVESGEVVLDITGQADIGLPTGDVTRRAAELRTRAYFGQVLVGDEAYRATRTAVSFRRATDEGADGWIVESVARPRLKTGQFVGRTEELSLLNMLARRIVTDGHSQLVTVLGPPGIGKTRITEEFCDSISGTHALVLSGHSLPSMSVGYGPFRQQLRAAANIADADTREIRSDKLTEFVHSVLPPAEADEAINYLGVLLGISEEGSGDRQLLFSSFRRVLQGAARRQPLVLVFDDIHWADTSSLDLVEWLAARLRDAPVLFVALARPELLDRRPTWGGGQTAALTIQLDGLDRTLAEQLVRPLLGDVTETSALTAHVLEAAAGNPLFLQELADATLDAGAGATAVPATITSAIAARLDALPAAARTTATAAAIVGPVFWPGAIRAQTSIQGLDDALDLLDARGFIRRRPGLGLNGDAEYEFRHILIRDGAYGLLPRSQRKVLHARAGRFIEESAGDHVSEWSAVLADHWAAAGEHDRAVDYLLIAAAQALGGWAKREAIALYDRALDLVGDEDDRAREILQLKAWALVHDGDYRAASVALDELLLRLEGTARLEALLARTKAAYWLEDAATATALAQQADSLAQELDAAELRAQAQAIQSHVRAMQGDTAAARPLAMRALDAWPKASQSSDLAYHLELLGLFHYWAGDHDAAVPAMERAYDLGRSVHSVDATIRSGASLALALAGTGRHRTAFELFDRVVAQGREIEHEPRFTARALNMRAGVHRDLFEFELARSWSAEAIKLAEQAGFHLATIQAGIDLLACDLAEGRLDDCAPALARLEEETSRVSGFHGWLITGRLLGARAELALATGDAEAAIEAAREAIAHATQVQRRKYEVNARLVLAAGFVRVGQLGQALDCLTAAHTRADALGHEPTRWRVATALHDARLATGDEAGASASALEADQLLALFCRELEPERAERVRTLALDTRRFALLAPDRKAATRE